MLRQSWTQQDIAKIRRLAGQVPASELARQLDRSEAATRFQASKIGVSLKYRPVDEIKRPVSVGRLKPTSDVVEKVVAPAAVERALYIYQQLQERDQSVVEQARRILTQHIFGLVDQGECDELRLTVSGLAHLKAVERDHVIKSALGPTDKKKASV